MNKAISRILLVAFVAAAAVGAYCAWKAVNKPDQTPPTDPRQALADFLQPGDGDRFGKEYDSIFSPDPSGMNDAIVAAKAGKWHRLAWLAVNLHSPDEDKTEFADGFVSLESMLADETSDRQKIVDRRNFARNVQSLVNKLQQVRAKHKDTLLYFESADPSRLKVVGIFDDLCTCGIPAAQMRYGGEAFIPTFSYDEALTLDALRIWTKTGLNPRHGVTPESMPALASQVQDILKADRLPWFSDNAAKELKDEIQSEQMLVQGSVSDPVTDQANDDFNLFRKLIDRLTFR